MDLHQCHSYNTNVWCWDFWTMFFDSQAALHLCLNCLVVYRVLSPQFSSPPPLRRIVSKCSGVISVLVWVLPLCSSNFVCCRCSIGFILASILRKEVHRSLGYGSRLLSTRYWELYYRIRVGPESRGRKYLGTALPVPATTGATPPVRPVLSRPGDTYGPRGGRHQAKEE